MKLFYNGVDLTALSTHCRILQQTTVREPPEAPQRERVTLRVRLDFFEQTYLDNRSFLEQVRAALKTQHATLLWQDDSGEKFLERTVTAGQDDTPEDVNARGGTYWQALVLNFWYYNHDLATNCLNATIQRTPCGGPPTTVLDLGAVEKWEERLNVSRFDELRDVRQKVTGTVAASGRWQADTTLDLDARRQALIGQKQALKAEIVKGASFVLSYGGWTQTVRVVDFKVDLDQPNNFVAWSLTVTYTAYPDEQNYLLCDVRVVTRENKAEGIPHLHLSGRIGAASESAARAKLALLRAALIPSGYAELNEETDVRTVESHSGTPDTGDGPAFIELTFALEYRDASSLTTSFQRDGSNRPLLDLGTVDKFSDRYQTTLFDEMRMNRKRTAGLVSLSGSWYAAESLSDTAKQAALIAKKQQFDSELVKGVSGTLVYGTVFNKVVRLLDFNCEVNRLKNRIDWSVSAGFTRFPNEADYAMCEFRVETRENKVEGTVIVSLAGRIGAPTPESAREKLGRLRSQMVPPGFVLIEENNTDHRVECESNHSSPDADQGDGPAYIELAFADQWQKSAGDVLTWTLRVTDEDDAKSGFVRSVFSGTVQAKAADLTGAFTTASAKAAELADNQYPFKVRSTVTEIEKLFQTSGGLVFVTVEFSYEYLRKGSKIFMEATGEINADTFGNTVETVSGNIAAPSLAAAQSFYTTGIRAGYRKALILSERTPSLSQQVLADSEGEQIGAMDDRFPFSFQVLRPKSTTSMAYTIEPQSNLQTLELRTVVRGTVRAASADVANAYLDSFLAGLSLGKHLESSRPKEYQRAGSGGGTVEVFAALHFTESYVDLLTGTILGILECEVSEEVQYSGDRLVVKPIPDGLPIVQPCGRTPGRRQVSARALATTESAASAWVKKMRTQMLSGTAGNYEEPPTIATVFRFLPQTDGTPRGTGQNVRLFECSGRFSEILPDYALA